MVLHFHAGNVGHNGWFFLEHLVGAGYRVLTPDRPGYLGTPISNGTTPEQQADLAAALLDTLDTQRVSVVGLSAGGPAAIQFAARHPHRVDALVLLSAISQRTGLSDFVKTETTYDAEAGKRYIKMVLRDPTQKRQVLAMSDAMVLARPRFDGVMNDLKVQKELGDLPLGDITAPTLVVGSRHDGDIGYANSINSKEKIAGSELITVDQFGHLIWWGDPAVTKDFQRRIEEFLGQHAGHD